MIKQKIIELMIALNIMAVALTGCGNEQTSIRIDAETAEIIGTSGSDGGRTLDEVSPATNMGFFADEYVYEIQADAYSDEEFAELVRERTGGGKKSKGKMTYEDGSYYVSEFDEDGNLVKDIFYSTDGPVTCYEYEYGTDKFYMITSQYDSDGLLQGIRKEIYINGELSQAKAGGADSEMEIRKWAGDN